MNPPKITREQVKPLFESRFLKVYDLQYAEGKHYYNATRRDAENLAATKSDEEYRAMLPDAVTCAVVLEPPAGGWKSVPGAESSAARGALSGEPLLLLSYEYRYPAGRFLLSPPAGLIDPEDAALGGEAAIFSAAKREILEETGLEFQEDRDDVRLVSPLLFSSPGMTDESNAVVRAVLRPESLDSLSQKGATGSELFDGFRLVTREEAGELLQNGCDGRGGFYSVYTWIALSVFAHHQFRSFP